ncbi:alpha-E domain-containing protein [Paracoccaceae bacterium GXU_MW_L88]
MLSRTAGNLYWSARYLERAETMSRLLDMGYRMALIPGAREGYHNEWESILTVAGRYGFDERYDEVNSSNVLDFLFFDRSNSSSVVSCITAARENIRAQRTAVTAEVWDALNAGYQEIRGLEGQSRSADALPKFCEWTRRVANQTRGAIEGTLLHGDGYDFYNIGGYLERAGATSRILDVKYYVLLPSLDEVGGGVDSYQWQTLLRAMSAQRQFHWAYGGDYTPGKIASFFLKNEKNPRSLIHCMDEIALHLDHLSELYGTEFDAQKMVRRFRVSLREIPVDEIISDGLHEFLQERLGKINELGASLSDTFFFGG